MKYIKENSYDTKINNIQSKFKFICQNYQKLQKQISAKNKIIDGLNDKVKYLQDRLQKSNKYVIQLEMKLNKKQGLNKTSSHKYINSKFLIPQVKENQYTQNKKAIQRFNNNAIQSTISIKDQLNLNYNRFSHLSPQQYKKTIFQPFKQDNDFSKRLIEIKHKINTESIQFTSNYKNKFQDFAAFSQKPRNLLTVKSQKSFVNLPNDHIEKRKIQTLQIRQDIKKLNKFLQQKNSLKNEKQNMQSQQDIKTLHKIWQERDSEICKMDEIFQSINDRLKEYEYESTS